MLVVAFSVDFKSEFNGRARVAETCAMEYDSVLKLSLLTMYFLQQ